MWHDVRLIVTARTSSRAQRGISLLLAWCLVLEILRCARDEVWREQLRLI